MRPWALIKTGLRDGEWRLFNGSATILNFNQRVSLEIVEELMRRMNDAKVPFEYTEGLKEIYFTFLPEHRGDYEDGHIRLSCDDELHVLQTTLVHELGHHLDEIKHISNRPKIIDESKKCLLVAPEGGKSYNTEEYIAIGFELFYFGKRGSKEKLKQENPKLYNIIKHLHKTYY